MSNEARVKYIICKDIEFEAIGSNEFVQAEREIFLNETLPIIIENITLGVGLEDVTETITTDSVSAGQIKSHFKEKTDIRDCVECWCNTCANIEQCEMTRDDIDVKKVDINRPYPCLGCLDGMRFKPKEKNNERMKCLGYVKGGINYG